MHRINMLRDRYPIDTARSAYVPELDYRPRRWSFGFSLSYRIGRGIAFGFNVRRRAAA